MKITNFPLKFSLSAAVDHFVIISVARYSLSARVEYTHPSRCSLTTTATRRQTEIIMFNCEWPWQASCFMVEHQVKVDEIFAIFPEFINLCALRVNSLS